MLTMGTRPWRRRGHYLPLLGAGKGVALEDSTEGVTLSWALQIKQEFPPRRSRERSPPKEEVARTQAWPGWGREGSPDWQAGVWVPVDSDGRHGGARVSRPLDGSLGSWPVFYGQQGVGSSSANTGVRFRAWLSTNEWTVHFSDWTCPELHRAPVPSRPEPGRRGAECEAHATGSALCTSCRSQGSLGPE